MRKNAHDNAPIWRPLWGAISVPNPPKWGGRYGCVYPPKRGGVCALCTPFLPPICRHSAPCNCAQAAPDGLPTSTRRVHPTRAQAPQRRPQWLTQPAPKSDPIRKPPAPLPQNARARIRPYTAPPYIPTPIAPQNAHISTPRAPQNAPSPRPSTPHAHTTQAPHSRRLAHATLAQAATPANGTYLHSSTAFDHMPHNALRSQLIQQGKHLLSVLTFGDFIEPAVALHVYMQRIIIAVHTLPRIP